MQCRRTKAHVRLPNAVRAECRYPTISRLNAQYILRGLCARTAIKRHHTLSQQQCYRGWTKVLGEDSHLPPFHPHGTWHESASSKAAFSHQPFGPTVERWWRVEAHCTSTLTWTPFPWAHLFVLEHVQVCSHRGTPRRGGTCAWLRLWVLVCV